MLEPYPCKRPECRPVTINKIIPLNITGNLMTRDGPFDSAYEPFMLEYVPPKIGYKEIRLSIADHVTFKIESYSERILYTHLEVVDSKVVPQVDRVNVSAPVIIRFMVLTATGDGWFETVTPSNTAGKFVYVPTRANVIIITEVGSGIITSIRMRTNPIEVIYDMVVMEIRSLRERVDVNTEAPITVSTWYEYDKQPLVGEVILSEDKIQRNIGLHTYRAIRVINKAFRLSVFTTNKVNVVFDRVKISLSSQKQRFDVGKVPKIIIDAKYEYDGEPFHGEIYLNNKLISYAIGPITYSVARIVDEKYYLKTFTANHVTVVFDRIMSSLNIESLVPFTTKITLKACYESDKKPVDSGILVIDNRGIYSDKRSLGLYITEYVDLSPIIAINGRFIVEGFDDVNIHEDIIHLGNIIVYTTTCLAVVLCTRRVAKVKTRAKVVVCPVRGSVNYIDIRIGRRWEYECQECGKKWYVKR